MTSMSPPYIRPSFAGCEPHGGEIATSHRVDAVRPAAEDGRSRRPPDRSRPISWSTLRAHGVMWSHNVPASNLLACSHSVARHSWSRAPMWTLPSIPSWSTRTTAGTCDRMDLNSCVAQLTRLQVSHVMLAQRRSTLRARSTRSMRTRHSTFGPSPVGGQVFARSGQTARWSSGPTLANPHSCGALVRGGTGIQTAPGAGQLIADLLRKRASGPDV